MAAVFLLAGCASLPNGKSDPRDPFERANRSIYTFNNAADRAVFRPAARAWKATVPQPVRHGLSNFVTNLAYPGTIINDLLQGKFTQGGHDLTRLLINTVFGFGFFDPASSAGWSATTRTLGRRSASGACRPDRTSCCRFLGPRACATLRRGWPTTTPSARHYISDPYVDWGLWGIDKLEVRASLLSLDAALDRTFDPYALIRNAWIQRREYEVRDGECPTTPWTPMPIPVPPPSRRPTRRGGAA